MNTEDVDALFEHADKELPAHPDWREGTQAGTKRAYLPVTFKGASTGLRIALVVKPASPDYLVINLLAGQSCIARLCLTGGHRDRLSRAITAGGHFHRWQDNRPSRSRIPKVPRLDRQSALSPDISTRDSALDYFLKDCGVIRPRWWPMTWPSGQVFAW